MMSIKTSVDCSSLQQPLAQFLATRWHHGYNSFLDRSRDVTRRHISCCRLNCRPSFISSLKVRRLSQLKACTSVCAPSWQQEVWVRILASENIKIWLKRNKQVQIMSTQNTLVQLNMLKWHHYVETTWKPLCTIHQNLIKRLNQIEVTVKLAFFCYLTIPGCKHYDSSYSGMEQKDLVFSD